MRNRIIATIVFNCERTGGRRLRGAFDPLDFVCLMRDLDRHRESGKLEFEARHYAVYDVEEPREGRDLRLLLHQVERVEVDQVGVVNLRWAASLKRAG